MKLNKLKKFAELLPEYITESKVVKGRTMGPAEYVRWQFPNRYGASLACHRMTNDVPEFAVTYDGDICYDSGVTHDVIGYTTVSEVALYLAKLRGL